MPSRVLGTRQEIEDFVRGCTFYGTGGGGLPENGIASLVSEMEGGRQIGWVDVDDIPDSVLTVCPFLMGSIAPHTPAVVEEMKGFGLVKPVNKEKDTLSKAIIELSQYVGKKVSAVVPIELGGANTPGAIAAASMNGIPTVDGDYTGRAIPEIPQTTPYLYGKTLWPISCVDVWGNVTIIKDAINYRMVERIGKLISAAAYGSTGDAGFLISGKEMKEIIIRGTLTECYNLGVQIRKSREEGKDPVDEVCKSLGGWVLIRGTVTAKKWEDRVGYYWGTHDITGSGDYKGNTLRIWFKNENHICWRNDEVFVTSPDIIEVVNGATGDPIANPKLKEGDKVAVIGLKARPIFRTEKGLGILGPKYFGHDYEYVPIEERML